MARLNPEQPFHCASKEEARNRAIQWLEIRGGGWGGAREVLTGNGTGGSMLEGREIGIRTTDGSRREIRVDWAPDKGPHYNVSIGKKQTRETAAFKFPAPNGYDDEMAQAWVAGFRETRPRG